MSNVYGMYGRRSSRGELIAERADVHGEALGEVRVLRQLVQTVDVYVSAHRSGNSPTFELNVDDGLRAVLVAPRSIRMHRDRRTVQCHGFDCEAEDLSMRKLCEGQIQYAAFRPAIYAGVERVPVDETHGQAMPYGKPCSVTYKIGFNTRILERLTLPRWVSSPCSMVRYCASVISIRAVSHDRMISGYTP